MIDLIWLHDAVNVADMADYTGLSVEDVKKVTDEVVKGLKALQTVDAVHVGRCKDCKYNKEHHPFNGKERITVFWCEMENRNARHNDNPDWFCADWKRKDE